MRVIVFLCLLVGTSAFANENIFFSFGSCNKAEKDQSHWAQISALNPDFFLWLGDAYYADTEDPEELVSKMMKIYDHPDYSRFRSEVPIYGTWDDHDFGDNNSDRTYPLRELAQQVFLDFIDTPVDSVRRQQKGIYTSFRKGDALFILLDNRYERDPESKARKGDILGEDQWKWLESVIQNSDAKVHFIASGSTVLTARVPGMEQWSNFPKSEKRLYKLLENVPGVVFLTGDLHFSGFLQKKKRGRKYVEFMSSGLTHTKKGAGDSLIRLYWGKGNYHIAENYSTIELINGEPKKLLFQSVNKQTQELGMETLLELKENGEWRKISTESLVGEH